MNIIYDRDDLERLEYDKAYTAGLNQSLVKQYRNRINIIRQADDERVFYQLKSLHFEKLDGKRKGQYSMRLNDQYRVILEFVEDSIKNKSIRVVEVVDYH